MAVVPIAAQLLEVGVEDMEVHAFLNALPVPVEGGLLIKLGGGGGKEGGTKGREPLMGSLRSDGPDSPLRVTPLIGVEGVPSDPVEVGNDCPLTARRPLPSWGRGSPLPQRWGRSLPKRRGT